MSDLSSTAFSAMTAVALAPDERQVWFQVLCDLDADLTWDQAEPALTTSAAAAGVGTDTVEEFLRVVANDSDPMSVLAELRAAGPDLLEDTYLAATAGPDTTDPAAGGEVDEAAWTEFLHSHGARWNREEDAWPQFRDWFLYEADQRGLGDPARAFVEYAESGDKTQTFADYQVPYPDVATAEPDVSAYPEVTEGDQGEWVAYADALLSQAGY